MENSGRRVMYRKVTPRPMPASANLYDRQPHSERALRAAFQRRNGRVLDAPGFSGWSLATPFGLHGLEHLVVEAPLPLSETVQGIRCRQLRQ